jgi:hypothetical protein
VTTQLPITGKQSCSASGTFSTFSPAPHAFQLPFLAQFEADLTARIAFLREQKALLLEVALLFTEGNSRLLRIMDYLAEAERHTPDPWLRDDIRIAWITCLFAGRGYEVPDVIATYQVLGIHPDKVWPSILARRENIIGRKPEAKKPVQSVPKPLRRAA